MKLQQKPQFQGIFMPIDQYTTFDINHTHIIIVFIAQGAQIRRRVPLEVVNCSLKLIVKTFRFVLILLIIQKKTI